MTPSKHWETKVFRYAGLDPSSLYYFRPYYRRRRETFCLFTPNRTRAAQVAREIYMELRTLGWEATLKKRSGPEPESNGTVTVGEFLDRVTELFSGQKRTIEDYCRHFRRLVADICEIERDESRYDYVNDGRSKWINRINKIPLKAVTGDKIQAWRVAYVARAADEKQRAQAKVSAWSILGQCRSLFSPKRLELLKFDPPIESPFRKIELRSEADMRYRSDIDAPKLVKTAMTELADRPEMLKAFLLAVCAGLRRNEIDKLEWSAFDWTGSTINIRTTRFLHVKTQGSSDDVDLDPETCALFRGFYARRQTNFVIESEIEPRTQAGYSHYRCQKIFAALLAWLREKGIKASKPLHTLRKEFGSIIAQQHGIHAASSALRHSDIGTTARHYIGKKQRTAVGLGHLLAEKKKIISLEHVRPESASAAASF